MAIKIAQTKTGTSTLASTIVTFDNNTVVGNTIIVAVGTNIVNDVSGITDTQGNSFIKAFSAPGSGVGSDLWYATNIFGGADTVTIAYSSAPTAAAVIQEYSGVDTITTLDRTATSSALSNSPDSTSTTQTNQQLELIIGGVAGISGTFTVGSGYGNFTQQANGSVSVAIEDKTVTSVGTYNATFGASGSIFWSCGVATLRAAPQGTTTSTSSTSASTVSTSSTSSSISSTSSSISSTSKSTSTSSTSISVSSTSSSVSSTSSSISSTSSSSTSSSTSVSSTSSSISSTSQSSTSQSSTSSSISVSSTSSSISSTSSSVSSTSASFSSTSASSTSSSSSTSTTAIPANLIYSYEDTTLKYKTPAILQTQTASSTTSVTSTNVVMSTTTVGSMVIVLINTDNSGAGVVSSISCTGMSFTKAHDSLTATSGNNVEVWYAFNISAATTPTLTINFTPNCISGAIIREYSNIATISPLDANKARTDTTASAIPVSPRTDYLTDNNELVIVWGSTLDSGNTYTSIPGFSNATTLKVGATLDLGMQDKILGRVTDFQQGAFSITNVSNWTCGILTFKAVSGLPFTGAGLTNSFTVPQTEQIGGDDGDYFIEFGSEYTIQVIKKKWINNTDNPTFTWKGRTTESTVTTPLLIQIYNVSTTTWETLANVNQQPADTDFRVTVTQSTNVSNYYDSGNVVTFRSYQLVV